MSHSSDPIRDPITFHHLRIERPLVVVALRATGTDPDADRLVEIGALRVDPGPAFTSF